MFKATIAFGSSEEAREQTKDTYEFSTQAELDAFMLGVDAASGWMDYEVCEDPA